MPRGPWTDEQRQKFRETMAGKRKVKTAAKTGNVPRAAVKKAVKKRGNGLDLTKAVDVLRVAEMKGEVRFKLDKKGLLIVERKQFVEI